MTGRHVEAFLEAYRAGRIVGHGAIAAMAAQAIEADKAEAAAAGRQRNVTASSPVQAARAVSDDELYEALFPTPAEAARRQAEAIAAAEARMRTPLSDAEADRLFKGLPD